MTRLGVVRTGLLLVLVACGGEPFTVGAGAAALAAEGDAGDVFQVDGQAPGIDAGDDGQGDGRTIAPGLEAAAGDERLDVPDAGEPGKPDAEGLPDAAGELPDVHAPPMCTRALCPACVLGTPCCTSQGACGCSATAGLCL